MATIIEVRDGVVASLQQHYPDIPIYIEPIEQGPDQDPCFFVQLIEAEHHREGQRRYRRKCIFEIHYNEATYDAMHRMAESLYNKMEYVDVNDRRCRGQGMKHSIVDSTLHFSIHYEFLVMQEKVETPKMQTMEQEGYVKHG